MELNLKQQTVTSDMMHDNVNDLIDEHSDSLTEEDLIEVCKWGGAGGRREEGLSLQQLAGVMRTAKQLQAMRDDWDPKMLRGCSFTIPLTQPLKSIKHPYP